MAPWGMRVLWVVALSGMAMPATAQPEPPVWPRVTGTVGAGVLLGAGEIARGRNAGGGEVMRAVMEDGPAMAVGLGIERGWAGLEFRVLTATRELAVTNEFEDRFPRHAGRPLLWSVGALLHPLPAIGIGQRLRPFVVAGIGGTLLVMDLDNRNGTATYHPWQRSIGGGLRVVIDQPRASPPNTMLELRVVHHRLWPLGRIHGVGLTAATLGLGLRL